MGSPFRNQLYLTAGTPYALQWNTAVCPITTSNGLAVQKPVIFDSWHSVRLAVKHRSVPDNNVHRFWTSHPGGSCEQRIWHSKDTITNHSWDIRTFSTAENILYCIIFLFNSYIFPNESKKHTPCNAFKNIVHILQWKSRNDITASLILFKTFTKLTYTSWCSNSQNKVKLIVQ